MSATPSSRFSTCSRSGVSSSAFLYLCPLPFPVDQHCRLPHPSPVAGIASRRRGKPEGPLPHHRHGSGVDPRSLEFSQVPFFVSFNRGPSCSSRPSASSPSSSPSSFSSSTATRRTARTSIPRFWDLALSLLFSRRWASLPSRSATTSPS